jgi:shikimate dehydrogenase
MRHWFTTESELPRFCVVGSPIAHSRSPFIHAAFGAQFGIELLYEKVEVRPGELAGAVQEFVALGGRGMNVTVPLKEEAFALAMATAPRAARAGAANTLWFEADGVHADNTDGVGLVRDLTVNHQVPLRDRRLLLLGAGGASRGVLPALLEAQPACVLISNRSGERAQALAETWQAAGAPVEVLPWGATGAHCDVVVNGTAASLAGQLPLVDVSLLGPHTVCYDMMYAASPTAFMTWAAANGAARVLDGLGMLVEQAAEAFSRWHAREPRTAAVIAELRQRLAAGL